MLYTRNLGPTCILPHSACILPHSALRGRQMTWLTLFASINTDLCDVRWLLLSVRRHWGHHHSHSNPHTHAYTQTQSTTHLHICVCTHIQDRPSLALHMITLNATHGSYTVKMPISRSIHRRILLSDWPSPFAAGQGTPHIFAHTYACTYLYKWSYAWHSIAVCRHVYELNSEYTVFTNTRIHKHVHTQTHVQTNIRTRKYISTRAHVHTHTGIHIATYTLTHTQT